MEVTVNNFSETKIDSNFVRRLVRQIDKKKWIVSISFIKRGKMKELNKKYRGKNNPTDVLSFSMKEGKFLGDVIICPSVAKENAKKFGCSIKSELARLAAHGILHLLGYKHGKKMFDLQEKVLNA